MNGRADYVGLERRRSPRLNDNIFIFGRLDSSESFDALTGDINADGLMFEFNRDISQNIKLEMEIYQPIICCKSRIYSIPVLARVAWIRKIEKDHFEKGENQYIVGVEFLEIKEEDRQRIVKYAEESAVVKNR